MIIAYVVERKVMRLCTVAVQRALMNGCHDRRTKYYQRKSSERVSEQASVEMRFLHEIPLYLTAYFEIEEKEKEKKKERKEDIYLLFQLNQTKSVCNSSGC